MSDDSQGPITEFRQEYGFLSNFWPCRVQYSPFWYPSVEHAYQAAKCRNPEEALPIRQAASASLAKRLGRKVVVRSDWERIKLEVMADLLWQKFVISSDLRAYLLSTGNRELIEGNTWGDTYWGVCGGHGTNHLGKLLMRLREVTRYLVENQPVATDSYSDGRPTSHAAP